MASQASQIQNKATKSIKIGIWDEQQHSRYLKGVVMYGRDWKQVRQVIETRQEKQIQSHHQKYLRRVAKMVKKIKRKGQSYDFQDDELVRETVLYRQLFTPKDITHLTPCQIRSMILCICSQQIVSPPRKQRNIIITNTPKNQSLENSLMKTSFSSNFIFSETQTQRKNSYQELQISHEQWHPSSQSPFIRHQTQMIILLSSFLQPSPFSAQQGSISIQHSDRQAGTNLQMLSLSNYFIQKTWR